MKLARIPVALIFLIAGRYSVRDTIYPKNTTQLTPAVFTHIVACHIQILPLGRFPILLLVEVYGGSGGNNFTPMQHIGDGYGKQCIVQKITRAL